MSSNTLQFRLVVLSIIAVLCGKLAYSQAKNPTIPATKLPNGWSLSPAGSSLALGDLPLNLAVSSDKRYFAVYNNGQSIQKIQLFSVAQRKMLDEIVVPKSWYGLKFSSDGKKIYASGGNDNLIWVYSINNEKLRKIDSLVLGKRWPQNKICTTGIELAGSELYTVTKEDSALYIFNTRSHTRLNRYALGAEAFSCLMRPSSRLLYISLWGSDSVKVFNTATNKFQSSIEVGQHPSELIFNRAGTLLFTSNANDNSVSIVDTRTGKELERLNTAVFPTALPGSTPNSTALSADEKTLYVANADNNCLAVFDISARGHSVSRGFIPTGWYPTQVRVIGSLIYVANGKGFTSFANPKGPNPLTPRNEEGRHLGPQPELQYIGSLMKGTLSIIPEPTRQRLATYTKEVYQNTPYHPSLDSAVVSGSCSPIPCSVGRPSEKIKYVFYVIKENRTYDQVLGDIKDGNGDPSLCIFPQKITPNQHAIARTFTLLDNFYVDAEVSADGHNWSTAAYANDFVEKNWPTSYGGRGGSYDFEGTRRIAFPAQGFIWDHANREHIDFRTYGEFSEIGKATIPVLENHFCPSYPGFNLSIPDSAKERIWERDFDSLLKVGKLPRLNTIRLANDHTAGQRIGASTVTALLADNDLAVGQLVEHLSHSPIWKESMVFILEDDAQNGSDHVDAHRSPAYIAGPFVKRNFVDHTMYSTSGMLRTIELILGMKPMSQYDAAATPLFNAVTDQSDPTPYTAIKENIDTRARNTAKNRSAERSMGMNFKVEDAAPDLELNEIIWKAVKGENAVMPSPRRSAFVQVIPKFKGDLD